MPLHNADIAAVFEEIANLLELGDENPFRVRAYRNAARVVGSLSLDVAARLAAGGELPKLPGIGADLGGKIREIATSGSCKLLEQLRGITLLKGIEVDILDDGNLDLPDPILSKLDVVVAAIHSNFKLSRSRQTERVLAALDNPLVDILAHPTGRLIGERAPYDVDMLAVVRKAKRRGVALELNAHPDRLDLNDVHCRMAKDEGVLVAIGSDAHGVDGFEVLHYGVGQARRGWLEKKDVLNARPLGELRHWLARVEPAASAV